MDEVVYEIPDHFKNFVVGFYIFGWLFQGIFFIFNLSWTKPRSHELESDQIGYITILSSIWKISEVSSTYALDHYELFGLRQGLKMGNMLKAPATGGNFVTLMHYKLVRHPIMTGFFIMFWSVPIMTIGKFTHVRIIFIFCAVTIQRCIGFSSAM